MVKEILKNRKNVMLFLIFLLALLYLPTTGTLVGPDSEKYVLRGLEVFDGKEISYLKRGPLFSYAIASSFYLFGVNVKNAHMVVRLFFSLNIILTYLIGKEVKNYKIGALASIFVMSSYGLNRIGFNLLADTIVPFFLLSYLLILIKALKRGRWYLYVLAGFTLGLEFLTKEHFFLLFSLIPITISIFPLPVSRINFYIRILVLYAMSVVTILPWVFYVFSKGGNLSLMLGKVAVSKGLEVDSDFNIVLNTIFKLADIIGHTNIFNSLITFYNINLSQNFILAPMLIIAAMLITVKNIAKPNLSEKILLVAVLMLLPIAVTAGANYYRNGGLSILFYLLYILLALFVYEISKIVSGYFENRLMLSKQKSFFIFFFLVSMALVGCQWFNPYLPTYQLVFTGIKKGGYRIKNTFWMSGQFYSHGRLNTHLEQAALWVNANALKHSKIALNFKPRSMNFYTNFGYKFVEVGKGWNNTDIFEAIRNNTWDFNKKPIFIYPEKHRGFRKKHYRRIHFLFEQDLTDQLPYATDQYYIIGKGRTLILSLYLDRCDWAKLVFENQYAKIYKISKWAICAENDSTLIVSDYYSDFVHAWEKKFPDEYEQYAQTLKAIGLDEIELESRSYSNFQTTKIGHLLEGSGQSVKIAFALPLANETLISEKRKIIDVYPGSPIQTPSDLNPAIAEDSYNYFITSSVFNRIFKYPNLVDEFKTQKPIIAFPDFHLLGDGWIVYKLQDRG